MIFEKYNTTSSCRYEVFTITNKYVGVIKIIEGNPAFITTGCPPLFINEIEDILITLRETK